MTAYLDVQDILTVAATVLEPFNIEPKVRDFGLLESAAARPRASVFGEEAYPDFFDKAAALMHSLASNHCLIDGNKRTAWTATMVFFIINDHEPVEPLDEDAAEALTLAVAQTQLEISEIATILRRFYI